MSQHGGDILFLIIGLLVIAWAIVTIVRAAAVAESIKARDRGLFGFDIQTAASAKTGVRIAAVGGMITGVVLVCICIAGLLEH